MGIKTTCIGAYPKPSYLGVADWGESGVDPHTEARSFDYCVTGATGITTESLDRATYEAVKDQVTCGIDIPTDGEQRRSNYIHYHCSHLRGIDFQNLTTKVHRNGAAIAQLPTILDRVSPEHHHFLDRDFVVAQSCTDKPVKITIPGPVTIMDTTADTYYDDPQALAIDLANAINFEIRRLAEVGCQYIQIDEPLFARHVDMALDFGIECLERCFHGLPKAVTRIMHMCCGYPGHLDDEDYQKADPKSYFRLAKSLDESTIDQISIEDAHRHNDLSLLESFSRSTVIFGCIAIATSRIETVDEIIARLVQTLDHIDKDRLIAAPDCGLMMLDRDLTMSKLTNLSRATNAI